MPILGENANPVVPTAAHGVARIQRIYNQMCVQVSQQLAQVKKIVDIHGRSAIDAEFGDDATEFANFYASAKTFAESHPSCSVEDLPS